MTDQDVFAFKPLVANTFAVCERVAARSLAHASAAELSHLHKQCQTAVTSNSSALPVLSPVVDFVMTVWKKHMRDG